LREGYGKDKHWVLLRLPSRDSAWSHYDCIRRRPDFLFCCFIEVTMIVVKFVSDGLRDWESETQLNLNRPLRISPGPRHLRRPLATWAAYDSMPASRIIGWLGVSSHSVTVLWVPPWTLGRALVYCSAIWRNRRTLWSVHNLSSTLWKLTCCKR
jgi:hypothetical protein